MTMCALALYKADEWGFKRPRSWMCKYGALSTDDGADHDEWREYRKVCKEIQKIITDSKSNKTDAVNVGRYCLRDDV